MALGDHGRAARSFVSIAILGGTFDPIHHGHLRAATAVAETFSIDEVLFVPAFAPPHKPSQTRTSPFHRFAMVALALESFDRFRISSIEADSLAPQYTVDTIDTLCRCFSEIPMLFVTGTDLYQDIDQWKDYETLLDRISFAVVNRPGFPMRHDVRPVEVVGAGSNPPLSMKPQVYFLDSVEENISSTDLRRRLASSRGVGDLVPPAVAHYIKRNKLYA